MNESLSLKPVHYIVTPDEHEEEVEVEHLLELKNGPRKSSFYQGRKKDYSIDVLLGNMFGLVANYVENNSTEDPIGGSRIESYTAVLLEGIRNIVERKDVKIIITEELPMGIDLSHATIGQMNVASDNGTVNVFNSTELSEKFIEFKKEFERVAEDTEKSLSDLPEEKKEVVKNEIVKLKGEVVKPKPDGGLIRASLDVLNDVVSTVSNAPKAVKTIGALIMLVKTFFGF